MKLRNLRYLLFLPILAACGGRLAMVGLGKDGKSAEAFVKENRYTRHLTEALEKIDESVVPALATSQKSGDWSLRTAVVGFGVKADVGIGPFRVAFRPRIRAAFANGEKPPIP